LEILRKITRLRPDIGKKYYNGEELHTLTAHVSSGFNLVRSCAAFVSSPAKIIIVQMLLYNEIGYLAFVMIAVMLVISFIQVIISTKLSTARKNKRDAANERSEFNLSALASIKHIRQLGWED